MVVKGYKVQTKKEAENIINKLNLFWRFPEKENFTKFDFSIFQTYGGGFWFFENSEWYEPALGNSTDFEIN